MQPLSRALRLVAVILLSHIVAACGGGGSDDGMAGNEHPQSVLPVRRPRRRRRGHEP